MRYFTKALMLFGLMVSFNFSYSQFVENKGQIVDDLGELRPEVFFVCEFPGVDVFFTEGGVVHYYSKVTPAKFEEILAGKIENPYSPEEWEEIMKQYANGEYEGDGFKAKGEHYRVDMTFPGADLTKPKGEDAGLQKNHYYTPQHPEGVRDVSVFQKIRFEDAYSGIDLVFYVQNGQLKYDFEVSANASIDDLKILYIGHQNVSIDRDGNAVVKILPGEIIEQSPLSFQGEKKINSSFKLSGDTLLFSISEYDRSQPLRIDPALVWSTYFHDASTSAAFTYTRPVWDPSGNMYEVFDTYNRTTFPTVNPGGSTYYSSTAGSTGLQLVIMKYNANRQIIWATYYPASQTSRTNFSNQCLVLDQSNNIYVTGQLSFPYGTPTPAFALYNPGGGAYYESDVGNGRNFILKFSSAGVRLWATMFNSPSTTSSSGLTLTGLAIDANNKLAISGQTYTPTSWQAIPLANPGGSHYYRSSAVESRVPTLHRFSTSGALEWSTYISQGVASSYNANVNSSLVVDQSNNIFLATDAGQVFGAGSATPYTLVNPGGGAYQDAGNTNTNNGRKISIFKFTSAGALYWNTLYGGNSSANSVIWQDIRDLTVLSNGDVVLVGRANTTNFPTFNPGGGAYMKTTLSSGSTAVYDGVILKFSNNGVRRWATYCGGNGTSDGTDFWGVAKDGSDNVTIGGVSRTTNTFPVLNQSGSYYQATNTSSYATVLAQFNQSGVQQWGTYYGNQSWMSSGGFGGDNAGMYVMFGSVVSPNTIPTVNPGGGAYYQSAHEASASSTDFIAQFTSCITESNTTSAATICENQTKPLTSSGSGGGTWSIVSGGGSIAGTTYTPANVASATSVTVRYTDGCGNTSDVTFTVNAISATPTTVSGTTTICSGSSTTLTVSGGSLGTGATAQWYTGSCGGTLVGTGNSITVSPTSTTTYYVRYNGTCNTTACISQAVTVNSNSTAPTTVSGTSTICSGSSTTLTVSGGSLGTGASAQWFTGSCGGTLVGTGNSITVSPTSTTTYYVRYNGTCNTTACITRTVTVNTNSTAPTGISGATSVCSGGSVTLTVVGGSAGTGATAQWYSGTCGGTPVGSGNSITVSPTSSITYFVRYEGTCNTTACASLDFVVNSNSTAPTTVSGTSTICSGSSTTLTVSGGSLGTGASAQWYTGSCGGTLVGTGSSITVSPTSTTTYYVRYNGTCNTTACISQTVTVNTNSTAPTTVSGTSTICSGSSTTLTVSGGSLGTGASAQWFTGSCGGTLVGTGNSITVSPTSTTTYYVRYNGTCGATTCITRTVTVNSNSVAPTGVSGTTTICNGSSTTLTLTGGTAGTGATAQWYSGTCGGTAVGSGNSITVSPTANTTYFVRYEGTCNTTTCASATVTVNSIPATPGAITGNVTTCSGTSGTYSIASVSGASSYTWTYSGGGTPSGSGTSVTLTPTSSGTLSVTATNSCGTSSSATLAITVNNVPATPGAISGTTPVCSGTGQTYTIGTVSGATSYTWAYSGGGTPSGTTTSATLTPTSSGTLSVTATNACGTSSASNLAITVNTNSVAPTSVSGTTTICNGSSTTLTLVGGTAGTGATAQWYSGTCGGTAVGSGNSITVSPTANTTYFVRYEGTCNTTTCASATVTVNAIPSEPTLSSNSPVCENGTINLTSSTVLGASYSWTGPNGFTSTQEDPSIASATTAMSGTYSCTVTVSGCTSTAASVSVTVNALPTVTIPGSGEVCVGNTITLSPTTGGTWSSSNTGVATITNAGLVTGVSSGTADMIYTDGTTGCSNTAASGTITVNPLPVVTVPGSGEVCEGGSITLSPTTGGTWSSSDISVATITNAGVVTGVAAGVAEMTFMNSTTGCASTSASGSVTVNALDDATFSYSSGTYCLTGTDPVASITGLSGGTFTINNGGTINGADGEIDLDVSGVNSYVVTYTTSGTCPNSSTANISITSAPSASFSYTGTPYCGDAGTATVTFGAGASGGVFSAAAGLSISASTGAVDLGASTPGVYTVSNDIAASGGCASASATASIEIIAVDDPTFAYGVTTYCISGTDPTPTISGTAGGGFTSSPAGLTLNGSTGEITLASSLANTYDVTYTTVGTCPATSTVQVTVTTSPTAGFTYTGTPYCEGSGLATVTFDPGASAGVFSELPSTGDLVINASTGEVDLNSSVPGVYTVENNIAAAGGCVAAVATTTITITVQDDPAFDYSGSTSFCENEANPVANITGASGGTFTSTPAGLTINGSTGEIDLTSSTLGATYDITYTTSGSCPDNSMVSVTLNESPTSPTVGSTATSNTICEGTSVDITASGSVGTGVSYSVFDAATGGSNLGATPLTVSPTTTTTYFVEAFNSNGCGNIGGRQAVTITVNPTPAVNAGADETICPGDNITLTATGTGSVVWSTTDVTPSITVSPAVTTTYTVVLTDANNCTNTDDVVVTVQNIGGSLIAVDDAFGSNSGVVENFDVLVNDTQSGSTPVIVTAPSSGTATVETNGMVVYTSNTSFVGQDTFTYAICDVFCVNICVTATVTVDVELSVEFKVPGGFSPNGDNINDVFVIEGLSLYPDNQLSIFNRWGGLVFEAAPYNNDWDGTPSVGAVLMGDKVTTGTYFFILDLGDGSDPLRGSIEVKRD